MKRGWFGVAALCVFALAGCAEAQQRAVEDIFERAAVPVVEQFLTAVVAGDRDAMAPLICTSLQGTLDTYADTFSTVEAAIEDLNCTASFANETVTCAGHIKVQVGLETQYIPFGTYTMVLEDGKWRWCGEVAG